MEVTAHDANIPSWVDVGTDLDKVPAFYSALFRWDIPPGSEETGGYTTATLRGKPVAGLGPQQDQGSYWTTYINVDSVDETVAKIGEAGGQTIVPPMDVLDVGRMAICSDTTGAVFGLWQPGTHKGAEIVNEPNSFCWNELITDDIEKAKVFYKAAFGWDADTNTGAGMTYTEFRIGDRVIAGMMSRPEGMPAEVPNNWGVYFAVEDLQATLAKIKELGGMVLTDVIDTPAGQCAPVMDTNFAAFNVIQMVDDHG